MQRLPWKTASVTALAVSVLLGVPEARGQARSRRQTARLTQPGRIGGGNPSTYFYSHSFGVGNLQRPRPGGNVLFSAIRRGASYDLHRPNRGPAAGGLSQNLTPQRTGMQLRPVATPNMPLPYVTAPPPLLPRRPGSENAAGLLSALAYVEEVEQRSIASLGVDSQEVTTLVPDEPSQYALYMREGEEALREGLYLEAEENFRLAMTLGKRRPECLLNMVHALFGSSAFSYAEAAHYLRRTLTYLPELPLVALKPRAFYASETEYRDKLLKRLEDFVAEHRQDANAQFVLAYYRWFDGDADGARSALELATKYTPEKEKRKLESIQAFWDGILASGQVTGQIGPATEPAPTLLEDTSAPTGTGADELPE